MQDVSEADLENYTIFLHQSLYVGRLNGEVVPFNSLGYFLNIFVQLSWQDRWLRLDMAVVLVSVVDLLHQTWHIDFLIFRVSIATTSLKM